MIMEQTSDHPNIKKKVVPSGCKKPHSLFLMKKVNEFSSGNV